MPIDRSSPVKEQHYRFDLHSRAFALACYRQLYRGAHHFDVQRVILLRYEAEELFHNAICYCNACLCKDPLFDALRDSSFQGALPCTSTSVSALCKALLMSPCCCSSASNICSSSNIFANFVFLDAFQYHQKAPLPIKLTREARKT